VVGEKIKVLRSKAGLTQKALADKSNLSRQHLNRIERGHQSKIEGGTLVKLAHGLQMSVEELAEYLSQGNGSSEETFEEILEKLVRYREKFRDKFGIQLTINISPTYQSED